MTKRVIKPEIIKLLLSKSGNNCAFPDCNHVLFNDDNLFVAQLCHIEGVSPGGQRHNTKNTIEQNNSFENLLFLCYRHHKETDNTTKYPVSRLKEIKNEHEKRFSEDSVNVIPTMILQIEDEMENYWSHISSIRQSDETGMMIELDANATYNDIIQDITSYLNYLLNIVQTLSFDNDNLYNEILELLDKLNIQTKKLKDLPYYENPIVSRNWEILNIGAFNSINVLKIRLKQLELKYYEENLKNNIQDVSKKLRLEKIKIELENLIQEIGYRD